MEKLNLYESLKILRETGIILEKKLRSEMTPEELDDARAKSKKRREARKYYEKVMHDNMTIEKPYYFSIYQRAVYLGNDEWREGEPDYPEYRAYPSEKAAKEALRGLDWNLLKRGRSLKWDKEDLTGLGWKIQMTDPRYINPDILKLLDEDLAKGYKESIHSRYDLY